MGGFMQKRTKGTLIFFALVILLVSCTAEKDSHNLVTLKSSSVPTNLAPIVVKGSNFNRIVLTDPSGKIMELTKLTDSILINEPEPGNYQIHVEIGSTNNFNADLRSCGIGIRIDGSDNHSVGLRGSSSEPIEYPYGPYKFVIDVKDLRNYENRD
jgi:hypothetical protein